MSSWEVLTKAADICFHLLTDSDWEQARNELRMLDQTIVPTLEADLEHKDPETFSKAKALMEVLTSKGVTRVYKGNIADHIYEYRQWLNVNYNNIIKPLLNPAPVHPNMAQLKSKRLYRQAHKTTTRLRKFTEGRRGCALRMIWEWENAAAQFGKKLMADYILHPEKCVYMGSGTPTELAWAMDLTCYSLNIQGAVRAIDQRATIEYLDANTEAGVPQDTCSYPQIISGAALRNDLIEGFPCAVLSNLTCDPAQAANALIERELGVPTFYLDHPYRFKSPDGRLSFSKQLRELVAFLEKHTGHTLDFNKLKEICERQNRLQELEVERWEHNYGAYPPTPVDLMLAVHFSIFGAAFAGTVEAENILRRQVELARQATAKKESCVPNQKYRAVLWNPPPASFANFANWIGRCWGVAICNDMESFGDFNLIDTSSEDALFDSLGAKGMNFIMSRHTRGDMTNFFGDLFKLCDFCKPDFIIMSDHVGCHSVNTLTGLMNEQCQQHGYRLMRFEQDLGDVRVTSHQGIRRQVNDYMTTIMNATPLDPSLLVYDDDNEW